MANEVTMTIAEFSRLAEAFGGDVGRWPAARRSLARGLLARDTEATRVLAEVAALDRLLSTEGAASERPPRELVDRIVQAAQRTPRPVPSPAVMPAVTSLVKSAVMNPSRPTFRRVELRGGAALLAASMVLGIYVGGSQFFDAALPALEELTGIELTPAVQGGGYPDGEADEDLL